MTNYDVQKINKNKTHLTSSSKLTNVPNSVVNHAINERNVVEFTPFSIASSNTACCKQSP